MKRLREFFAIYTTQVNPKAQCGELASYLKYVGEHQHDDI